MITEELLQDLSAKKQIRIATKLLAIGIDIWDNFCLENSLSYNDSVVGVHHSINPNIVQKSIDLAKKYLNRNRFLNKILGPSNSIFILSDEFREPITALQDDDWEIPKAPRLIFYAAYNLTKTLAGKTNSTFNEPSIDVSINQSINAIMETKMRSQQELIQIIKSRT